MSFNYDDVVIIIRAAGERTEGLCKKLILDQGVQSDKIHLIHEVPFSAALRKSYEIGIESGCRWTLCVDADLLLRPGSISEIITRAEKKTRNICEVQGFMLDKFFGGIRKGGIHLYRSETLPEVMKQIPPEGVTMRPESQTLHNMKKLGYSRSEISYVVGLHDEEQYNSDIYRKVFVHGVKHTKRIPLFVEWWKENLQNDPDFKVALYALSDSIHSTEKIYIDKGQDLYAEMFSRSGFSEKEELNSEDFSLEWVEEKIVSWKSPGLYYSHFPNRDGYDSRFKGYLNKFGRLNRRFGAATLLKMGWNRMTR